MTRRLIALFSLLMSTVAYAASPQTVTLNVQNMTCATCRITVEKALKRVPGVASAQVDFEKKTATVEFDPDKVIPATLTKATTDAGFPATVKK
jgi:periplasmic mercuric ion binding protein